MMKSVSPATFLAGADEAYAPNLAVALTSVLDHLDPLRDATVVVMDGGIKPATRDRLTAAILRARPTTTLRFVSPDLDAFEAAAAGTRFSAVTFARLCLADFMPDDAERILYIDADTMVTEDVGRLFDIDTRDHPIWAVVDSGSDQQMARLSKTFQMTSVTPNAAYFNSGVMLIDMPAWRRDRITERALDIVRRDGARLRWADQDVLNILMAGRWGVLEDKWNNQIHGDKAVFPELFANGKIQGILHWAGPAKPWHPLQHCRARGVYLSGLKGAKMVSGGALLRLRLLALLTEAMRPVKRLRRKLKGGSAGLMAGA